MRLKKLLVLVLIMGLACSVVFAGGTKETTAAAAPTEETALTPASIAKAASNVVVPASFDGLAYKDLKAAILVPDSYTEPGWSQTGALGMDSIEAALGCTTTIVEAASPDQMKTEAEALADDGYQLIVGHGNQYEDAFNEICGDYPDTLFVTMGGTTFSSNQLPIYSALGQPYYLLGIIAGAMTESNKTAFIAGANWNSFLKEAYSYYEGVKAVNPDCEYSLVVMNDYTDANEAYETAVSLVNSGCDYIAVSANASNSSVMQACEEYGVACASDGVDYSSDYPNATFGSVYTSFESCFPVFAKELCDGTFEVDPTGNTSFGYSDGYWEVIMNPNFPLSAEAQAKIDEIMADPDNVPEVSELDITLGTYVFDGS